MASERILREWILAEAVCEVNKIVNNAKLQTMGQHTVAVSYLRSLLTTILCQRCVIRVYTVSQKHMPLYFCL